MSGFRQIALGAGGSTGVYAGGASTVQDSTITGDTGFNHSGTGTPDTLSRVSITASWRGVATDSGDVDVDDTLIDLGTSNATGLYALNYNASTAAKTIDADHVTIVGGGPSSIGAFAYAARSDVVQQSSVTLANSIVRGPATSLRADAGNTSGGGTSTATVTASYSDWQVSTQSVNEGSNGSAQVVSGAGNVDVDPAFVDAAGKDYRLATGSPVVDHGDPASGGPATDRSGSARVLDGNGDGTAVRDMGAYEHATVPVPAVPDTTAPDTRFTSKPAKRVTKRRVRFGFASTELGSAFSCKLDKLAWRSCASPYRFKVKVGVHRFQVRATDASGNTDATPATFRFRRVR